MLSLAKKRREKNGRAFCRVFGKKQRQKKVYNAEILVS